jgi:hypothetical protein
MGNTGDRGGGSIPTQSLLHRSSQSTISAKFLRVFSVLYFATFASAVSTSEGLSLRMLRKKVTSRAVMD